MADLSWAEIAEGIGTATGDTLVDLANVAADFFCDVYSQFPAAIINSPLDNPGARFADGLARRICAPRDKLPPNPPPAPEGGQCPCVEYDVEIEVDQGEFGSVTTNTYRLLGPIGGVAFSGSEELGGRWDIAYGSDLCGGTGMQIVTSSTVLEQAREFVVTVLSITRVDGLPDNCGSGYPTYPLDTPSLPDVKAPRTVPVGGVPVDVNVEITPIKFEVGVSIKPEFNVNIGGIQVNFGITGAKITIAPTLKLPDILPPALDPRDPPPPPLEPGKQPIADPDLKRELDAIKDKLDEIEECACEEDEGEGALLTDVLGSGTGGVYTLPPRCEFVKLELTVLPSNERIEFGNGTSQNVIYAGWYSFGTSEGDGDRLPVSYEENCFFAPKGATRFAYTVRKGASAIATAFYRAEPEE